MEKLSPQKELLVSFLRDYKWHCASEWANRVKDDRTRFCELETYMAQRGYKIASESCRGSVCGRRMCPLNKRRAEKIVTPDLTHAQKMCAALDRGEFGYAV